MKRMTVAILAVLCLVAGGLAYVRLAPSDVGRWHKMPDSVVPGDFAGGVLRIVDAGPEGLVRLDALVRDTPRTQVLAGSLAQGMLTYVTRSAFFGFPDYTTVRQRGAHLEIYARLRFGRSDLGVNRARVEQWLSALGPLR